MFSAFARGQASALRRVLPAQPAVGSSCNAVAAVRSAHTCVSTMVAGREMRLETGKLGPLADAVVYARYGNTSMLVSAVASRQPSAEDFLPLQVDYRERAYATGLIPTTPTRKEAPSSDREILASRIIDRTVRPLFPEGYHYETQLIATLLSYDRDCDPALLSVVGASAALHMSQIPWAGPAAAVRIGWVDGKPVLCPTWEQGEVSKLDLLYAGAEDRCLMIEADGKEVAEADMIGAMRFAEEALDPLLALQHELRQRAGSAKYDVPLCLPSMELMVAVEAAVYEEAKATFKRARTDKSARSAAQGALQGKAAAAVKAAFPAEDPKKITIAAEMVVRAAMRAVVEEATLARGAAHVHPLRGPPRASEPATPHVPHGDAAKVQRLEAGDETALDAPDAASGAASTNSNSNIIAFVLVDGDKCRVDGRSTRDVRQLTAEVDVLPVVHGSAIFARGDTQVLAAATIGPLDLVQTLNAAGGISLGGSGGMAAVMEKEQKHFFLHYDFPPFSTNEVGKLGGINRRMVGHGALAEKAVAAVLPSPAAFPYTIRVNSEVMGSDGSSSMASVCGASLALMDAGVPLKAHVAGISIGCISPSDKPGGMQAGDRYILLTDIFGLEDHTGDMDFKVAGTTAGITAIQLDVKPAGLPLEVLEQAIWRARTARLQLLEKMGQAIERPRAEMKPAAPRVETLEVPPELRAKLVGPGGTNLRRIESLSGARLILDETSTRLSVYASPEAIAVAKNIINSTVQEHLRTTGSPLAINLQSGGAPVLVVGLPITATVSKTNEFGAVLDINGTEVGWMHISEFARSRSHKTGDYLCEGDEVTVQVCDVDSRGRGKFSIRSLLRPGEDVAKYIKKKVPGTSVISVAAPAPAPAPQQHVADTSAAPRAVTASATSATSASSASSPASFSGTTAPLPPTSKPATEPADTTPATLAGAQAQALARAVLSAYGGNRDRSDRDRDRDRGDRDRDVSVGHALALAARGRGYEWLDAGAVQARERATTSDGLAPAVTVFDEVSSVDASSIASALRSLRAASSGSSSGGSSMFTSAAASAASVSSGSSVGYAGRTHRSHSHSHGSSHRPQQQFQGQFQGHQHQHQQQQAQAQAHRQEHGRDPAKHPHRLSAAQHKSQPTRPAAVTVAGSAPAPSPAPATTTPAATAASKQAAVKPSKNSKGKQSGDTAPTVSVAEAPAPAPAPAPAAAPAQRKAASKATSKSSSKRSASVTPATVAATASPTVEAVVSAAVPSKPKKRTKTAAASE